MTALFAQAFLFIVLAFALGLAVGWLFWRFRRVSVADEDWAALRRELDAAHAQLGALRREREEIGGQAARVAADAERLQGALTTAWHDRDVAALELRRVTGALADTRDRLERTAAQARYLQRRVAELSLREARERESREGRLPALPPQHPRPGNGRAVPGGRAG